MEASLGDPGGPILQLSDERALGGQHPEHAPQELQDGGGDAPAPAHEGPEERELPAALRGGRAAERLRGQAALRAPAAGRAAAAEQGDLVDSYDPALKEHRTVCFLAFDGHSYSTGP